KGSKVSAIEVKSSGTGKHESMTEFRKKYSKNVDECYILSQKDIDKKDDINYMPIYLTSFLCK
ncbi:MAG: ATPase, partial [Lachnospiraceae bacterium]|nr:ATPase [Lachnospiraceae bacterium]